MSALVTEARPGRRWPWLVAAVAVCLYGLAVVVLPAHEIVRALSVGPTVLSSATIGALLLQRRPGNSIGALLLTAACLMGATAALAASAVVGTNATSTPWPGASVAGLVAWFLFDAVVVISLVGVPLVFPSGRLESRWWRWVIVPALCAPLADTAQGMLRPGPVPFTGVDNPLGDASLVPALDALYLIAVACAATAFAGTLAVLWMRFQRGDRARRQQLKWFLAAAGLGAIVNSIAFVLPGGPIADTVANLGTLSLATVPIAIGIAVLRYRLYAIDRVISRTVSWTIVTALLAGVFVLLVLGLQGVLVPVTGEDTLAVAGSTLAVAALFQPLRTRVQHVVDRRFQRSRYDTERLVEAFGDRLRGEVDLQRIEADVLDTVVRALQPDGASIWDRGEARDHPAWPMAADVAVASAAMAPPLG